MGMTKKRVLEWLEEMKVRFQLAWLELSLGNFIVISNS